MDMTDRVTDEGNPVVIDNASKNIEKAAGNKLDFVNEYDDNVIDDHITSEGLQDKEQISENKTSQIHFKNEYDSKTYQQNNDTSDGNITTNTKDGGDV